METANLAGLSQAGAPGKTRGSRKSPTIVAASVSNIAPPTNVRGRLEAQALRRWPRGPRTRVLPARERDSKLSIIGPLLLVGSRRAARPLPDRARGPTYHAPGSPATLPASATRCRPLSRSG